MANEYGKFVWYELMTNDLAAAEAFYRPVVGWEAADAGMEEMRYTIFSAARHPVCGAMVIPEGARDMGVPPSWIGYIAVEDVDETAAKIAAEGGVVHRPPADIPDIGRFAIVGDPQGAAFALFRAGAGEPPPPVALGTPGHVGWRELYAADGETAFDFYAETFLWQLSRNFDMGPMGNYKIFSQGGVDSGGIMTKPVQMPVPAWTFYFNVTGIDAAAGRVTAGGGKVINGPMEVPGGSWIVQCLDPQGAMFALASQTK